MLDRIIDMPRPRLTEIEKGEDKLRCYNSFIS